MKAIILRDGFHPCAVLFVQTDCRVVFDCDRCVIQQRRHRDLAVVFRRTVLQHVADGTWRRVHEMDMRREHRLADDGLDAFLRQQQGRHVFCDKQRNMRHVQVNFTVWPAQGFRPFQKFNMFVDIPMVLGKMACVVAFQRRTPIEIDAFEVMVVQNLLDGRLAFFKPTALQAHDAAEDEIAPACDPDRAVRLVEFRPFFAMIFEPRSFRMHFLHGNVWHDLHAVLFGFRQALVHLFHDGWRIRRIDGVPPEDAVVAVVAVVMNLKQRVSSVLHGLEIGLRRPAIGGSAFIVAH